ncbi:hypothetical protein PPERSA_12439 [Pseudocohnilembus persalinus]|uniref:Uncharacterized protein n=1 Tax=Pseudocohnilembus persalinus TaxID=266149 RepID=A0A0V0QPK3_PSEPJ|nr:hypothetical protein PPERSA_12439 [Pseudocohnilembus persalinus]|eukprot:KRX03992.1 hypothetical protein PPERSA_12439 [Pseudocohnilembus persalinus]
MNKNNSEQNLTLSQVIKNERYKNSNSELSINDSMNILISDKKNEQLYNQNIDSKSQEQYLDKIHENSQQINQDNYNSQQQKLVNSQEKSQLILQKLEKQLQQLKEKKTQEIDKNNFNQKERNLENNEIQKNKQYFSEEEEELYLPNNDKLLYAKSQIEQLNHKQQQMECKEQLVFYNSKMEKIRKQMQEVNKSLRY